MAKSKKKKRALNPIEKKTKIAVMVVGGAAAVGLGIFAYKKLHKKDPLAALPTFDPSNGSKEKGYAIGVFFSAPQTVDDIKAAWKPLESVRANLGRMPVSKIVVSPEFSFTDDKAIKDTILSPIFDPTPDMLIAIDEQGTLVDAALKDDLDKQKALLRLTA
jgi:hypothetical protein